MKYTFAILLFLNVALAGVFCQSQALYDDSKVAEIIITMPLDSFNYMVNNAVHTYYTKASFQFDDGSYLDTLNEVGIRLRGNTSLSAQKKSFKISFNEYDPDKKYQEVRKLNLRGQHNDPTMIRERLFYKVWEKAGMPPRRSAFVKLYIAGTFMGLYTNIEEIDKIWLQRAFGNNDGNLYKCTYPADLAYINDNEWSYKSIMNNPESRAYDLVTNESDDNYARLVTLIKTLNLPVDASYPDKISQILNVQSVLKSFAIDIVTGNWDDYFYNKNNYYLYDNPATGKFEFFTFDTDNTFGVDWVNQDWTTRNCLSWQKANEARPLATKLLAVPAYKDQFIRYLDTLTRFITLPDSIFPTIDLMHNKITSAAIQDVYRTYDYGYSVNDFHNGFTQTVDGHTPYGIKPFLTKRHDKTLSQIAGLIATGEPADKPPFVFDVFPNPAKAGWYIQIDPALAGKPVMAFLYDPSGKQVWTDTWTGTVAPHLVENAKVSSGDYLLKVIAEGEVSTKKVRN